MSYGKLYLIPVPLGEGVRDASFTPHTIEIISNLQEFIVENEKTARKFIKLADPKVIQEQLILYNYGKHARDKFDINNLIKRLKNGVDIGLMSEAGCPAVADPGSNIVREVHKNGIIIVPLVGPSSILLALMASGFNGQGFAFEGYLPIGKEERVRKIKSMELRVLKEKQTQIFMETPFRNNQLLSELIRICKPQTQLSVAMNLTLENEQIVTQTIATWRTTKIDLHKIPVIFLLF